MSWVSKKQSSNVKLERAPCDWQLSRSLVDTGRVCKKAALIARPNPKPVLAGLAAGKNGDGDGSGTLLCGRAAKARAYHSRSAEYFSEGGVSRLRPWRRPSVAERTRYPPIKFPNRRRDDCRQPRPMPRNAQRRDAAELGKDVLLAAPVARRNHP